VSTYRVTITDPTGVFGSQRELAAELAELVEDYTMQACHVIRVETVAHHNGRAAVYDAEGTVIPESELRAMDGNR
jgi:hypothetical protein